MGISPTALKRLADYAWPGNVRELENAIAWVVALAGNLVYEQKNLSEHRKSEHVYFRPDVTEFVENYLLVRNPANNEVIGVIEIYKVPRILLETLKQTRWVVWAAAGFGGLFLYAMLFGFVRRANMVILSQQEKIIESETVSVMGEMAAAVAHATRDCAQNVMYGGGSSGAVAASTDAVLESRGQYLYADFNRECHSGRVWTGFRVH